MALVHEARLARSDGGALPRAALLEDAIDARAAHESLRQRFNAAIDDLTACR